MRCLFDGEVPFAGMSPQEPLLLCSRCDWFHPVGDPCSDIPLAESCPLCGRVTRSRTRHADYLGCLLGLMQSFRAVAGAAIEKDGYLQALKIGYEGMAEERDEWKRKFEELSERLKK